MKIYEVGSGQQYQEGIEAIALINYIIPLADIEGVELVRNEVYCHIAGNIPLYIARYKTYTMAKQCYDELINVWHLWQIPFLKS